MDPQTIGRIGGITGVVPGLLGAAIGVYASLTSAPSFSERRFVLVGSAVFCVLIGGHLTALFLIPKPWNGLSWLVYSPLLIRTIVWFNRRQAKLRAIASGGDCGTARRVRSDRCHDFGRCGEDVRRPYAARHDKQAAIVS